MLIVELMAHLLTSDAGQSQVAEIHSFRSNQEERIVLYLQHAMKEAYQSNHQKHQDSDVFFFFL